MRLDERVQRRERAGAGADLIRQRRDAEVDAFAGEAVALPVQRLMLAELVEQDLRT
jgi:stage V sporulation protein SpoVS